MRLPLFIARSACIVVALTAVGVVGCGSSNAKLTGKVTYKDTPLKGGTVTLVPVGSGVTFSTLINADGTYSFDQVRSGKYKVCVETESLKPAAAAQGPTYGGKTSRFNDKSKIKNAPPPGAQVPEGYAMADPFNSGPSEASKRYVAIPPEYSAPGTTTLEVEVKGGSQQHDIPLS
jgi:Carboxypeptidase regulatory-like domain